MKSSSAYDRCRGNYEFEVGYDFEFAQGAERAGIDAHGWDGDGGDFVGGDGDGADGWRGCGTGFGC